MKTYAIIKDSVVVNLAIAEDAWPFPDDIAIDVTTPIAGAQMGATYINGVFTAPPAPTLPPTQPIPPATKVTPLSFLNRFTDAEQLGIVAVTMQSPAIKLWYDKLLASTEVVFSDPRVSAGLDAMVAAGLLTQVRSEEIVPISLRSTGAVV